MARKRKNNAPGIQKAGFKIDPSYAKRGQTAAWALPNDNPGRPPSMRTLTPSMNRHLDKDPLAPRQTVGMSSMLQNWRMV